MLRSRTNRDESRASAPYPARRGRLWPRLLAAIGVLLALVAGLGFVSFAEGLPRDEPVISKPADGIVVLTGGASRVVDAVELLAEGRGKRLLISGVHPATTPEELTRVNPDFARLLDCCIDLGHEATNTIGNALETGRWVRERNFHSLIIVTSGWHMPRALVEIEREVPQAELIPYPVVTDRMRDSAWWSDAATVRLLFIEYVKYVATVARVHLDLVWPAIAAPARRS